MQEKVDWPAGLEKVPDARLDAIGVRAAFMVGPHAPTPTYAQTVAYLGHLSPEVVLALVLEVQNSRRLERLADAIASDPEAAACVDDVTRVCNEAGPGSGLRRGPVPAALLRPCPKCGQPRGAWCLGGRSGSLSILLHGERAVSQRDA